MVFASAEQQPWNNAVEDIERHDEDSKLVDKFRSYGILNFVKFLYTIPL